ncbi:MAG: VCBS repeat-containing protein, partial [Bacteroidota bacterium]
MGALLLLVGTLPPDLVSGVGLRGVKKWGFPWVCILCVFCNSLQAQLFRERAIELGIEHHAFEATAMAGGVTILDFDNDGYEDIYFTGGDAPDKLFHNQGDGYFVDVSQNMRLTVFNIVTTMGVVSGDVDNDGYTDLFVTTT